MTRSLLVRVALAALVALGATVAAAQKTAETKEVVVFAAASLKNVLDAIGTAYEKETGKKIVASYAASSALAKQIESGAPAQVYISADIDWMNYLDERGLIAKGTAKKLLGNTLVLVAPKDKAKPVAIEPGFALDKLLRGGRLAVAGVEAVPAGKYAKAALENLGVWNSVKDSLAQAENVRAALLLVSRGEAPLGIVYATDARSDPGVAVVGTFPETSHPPIVYMAGLVAKTADDDARRFFEFLGSDKAKSLFQAEGFATLD